MNYKIISPTMQIREKKLLFVNWSKKGGKKFKNHLYNEKKEFVLKT